MQSERVARLEEIVKAQGEEIEAHDGVLDHLLNTTNTIILPRQEQQAVRQEQLARDVAAHDAVCKESVVFMATQRGAWQMVQRVAVVLAALASLATLVMKVVESAPK